MAENEAGIQQPAAAEQQQPAAPVTGNSFDAALSSIAQRRAAEDQPAEPGAPAPAATVPATTTPAAAAQESSQVATNTPAAATATPGQNTPEPPAAPPQATDWRDAIKNVNVAELLAAKGVDEKVSKLFDKYSTDGDLTDYFKAYGTDYDKMPDTDVLKLKVYDRFAGFSDEEKAEMYQAELEKYHLDPSVYDEAERRRAGIMLKADLQEYRNAAKAKQAETLIPKNDVKAQYEAQKAAEKAAMDQYAADVVASEVYKGVVANQHLTVGAGEIAFNMDVNADTANKVVQYLTNNDAYTAAYLDANGKPDYAKQFLVGAFAVDPLGFLQKMADHLGKVKQAGMVKELGNEAAPAQNGVPAAAELNPARQLITSGAVRF
jgi:ribosomal protein L35AE/L33A